MYNTQEASSESRILEAAETVFMREGFDGARMQVIADTAGINKALLHYYFRSKQRLFEQVLGARMRAFIPEVKASFETRSTASDKIEAFVDAYLRMLMKNPQLPMFILFAVYKNPAFVQGLPDSPFEPLVGYLNGEINAGRMRRVDPVHFFVSLLSMCIFPFVSRNLACHMMGKDSDAYTEFLSQRKPEIMHVVNAMMIP
jgi:AcrR family transcriptional regulator